MAGLALALGTLEVGDPEGDPGGIEWNTDNCWHSGSEQRTSHNPWVYKDLTIGSHQIALVTFVLARVHGIRSVDRPLTACGTIPWKIGQDNGGVNARGEGGRGVVQRYRAVLVSRRNSFEYNGREDRESFFENSRLFLSWRQLLGVK